MQALALQNAYYHDQGTYTYVRKMMALPFLSEGEIEPEFQRLQRQAESPVISELADYVSRTWINGTTWRPSDWTVFKQAVRTNNHLEGWHHGLNRRAAGLGQLPLYVLVKLLHRKAQLTAIQIRLVSENKLRGIQRSKSSSILFAPGGA